MESCNGGAAAYRVVCSIDDDVAAQGNTLNGIPIMGPAEAYVCFPKAGVVGAVGTGAVIINGTREHPMTIADDAVIGAGACVTRPVPAGITVVGVPAKPMGRA